MSKQTGLVTFTGRIGGISFYKLKGVDVARRAGGPSRTRIFNDPNFARTRENISEFTALAQALTSLLHVLAPVRNLLDSNVRGSAGKIFRAMIKADDAPRGQRKVMISAHRASLQGLELNADNPLSQVLKASYTTAHSSDRKTATVSIADLRANKMIKAPAGATHFQVALLAGVMSDVIYNVDTKRYRPADATLNELTDCTHSEYYSLGDTDPLTLNLQTVLPQPLNNNVTVLLALGILFATKNGSTWYPLQQGKALQVVEVY